MRASPGPGLHLAPAFGNAVRVSRRSGFDIHLGTSPVAGTTSRPRRPVARALSTFAASVTTTCDRIASVPVAANMAAAGRYARDLGRDRRRDQGWPEAGLRLACTDSPPGLEDHVDITGPAHPARLGDATNDGEPTAGAVIGVRAWIGVGTTSRDTAPSVRTVSMEIASGETTGASDLGGQPDSVATGMAARVAERSSPGAGVVCETGAAFERALIRIGHHRDRRSDAGDVAPEA